MMVRVLFLFKCFNSVLVLLVFIFSSTLLFSQSFDSLDVDLNLFNKDDIEIVDVKNKKVILSSDRLGQTVDESSNQIIIIEGSEIRKFGYTTLGDVFKYIPGFVTSQPGNTYEGETFLMRGLNGNEYAKFMINGIQIKPEAVRGMPIGAQLPIRHAQRIEISMGPSSTSYGSDCMGGYINIIMPEVDHPVYAWGDINFLSPKGNDFNLTIGGKSGKGKNLFTYQLFASSYSVRDVHLVLDEEDIKVDNSLLNSIQNNNVSQDTNGLFRISELNKESRTLGAQFKYRRIDFSAIRMFREENSAFGMNPLQQSYDSNLSIGENNTSFSLKYRLRSKEKHQSKISISVLNYQMLPGTAYFGSANVLSSGKNYMYSSSFEVSIDYQSNRVINSRIKLVSGFSLNTGTSNAFTNFRRNSFSKKDFEPYVLSLSSSPALQSISMLDSIQPKNRMANLKMGGFGLINYVSESGKFRAEAGLRFDYYENARFTNGQVEFGQGGKWLPSPKLGFVYKPIERLRFNVCYDQAFRNPSSYYLFNNYMQLDSLYKQGSKLKNEFHNLKSEKIKGIEAGIQFLTQSNSKFNINYYGHLINNKIFNQTYSYDSLNPNKSNLVGFGYYNSTGTSILNTVSLSYNYVVPIYVGVGVRDSLKNESKDNQLLFDFLISYDYSVGKEYFYSKNDVDESKDQSSPYLFAPNYSFKFQLNIKYNDFILSFRNNVYGKFVTDVSRFDNLHTFTTSQSKNNNLDIFVSNQLFRQLNVFLGVTNVLNTKQNGIPYKDLSSVWTINPQYWRTFKFGLTFKLN